MNNTINVSIDCVPAALREFFAEHSTIALAFPAERIPLIFSMPQRPAEQMYMLTMSPLRSSRNLS